MELLILFATLLLCAVILRAVKASPLARHFADVPDHRKVHHTVIPRFGGVGIILAFLAALALLAWSGLPGLPRFEDRAFLASVAFVGVSLLVGGGWDDVRNLGFKTKFLLQFLIAGGVVLLIGRDFDMIAVLGYRIELGVFGPLISIFWLVAVMNALNIIDGIDGLAGGVALCGFAAVAFMAHANGAPALVALCLAVSGAILGFLRFNFSKRHKIFLGDAGSQFLGALLALFTIEVQGMAKTGFSIWVPLFIVGYPLLDISVAMVRRFRCGRRARLGPRLLRMFAADNEHLHHRLVYLGLSHVQSTFLLLMLAGGIGATAIIISRLGWPYKPMVMAYLGFAVVMILNRLGYIGLRPWLTFPRTQATPSRIVGVIEPDEVFMHSLTSFKQDRFSFLAIPGKVSQFLTDDLVAVLIYNASSDGFEDQWTKALRVTEVQDCPAVVIAEEADIERVRALHPEGFRLIHFVEKPVRVPELVRMLEGLSIPPARAARIRERRFSLAELTLRNRNNA